MKSDDLTVVYSLTNPIRSKIVNFNKFVSNLGIKAFFQGNIVLTCSYACSGFIGKYHQLIVTGELRIVGNNKLGKLNIKEGPKYRRTNNI